MGRRPKFTTQLRNRLIIERCREILREEGTMTLRHLYYLLVSDKKLNEEMLPKGRQFANTQKEYKNLCKKTSDARHLWENPLPCDSLVDGTREYISSGWWDSLEERIVSGVKHSFRSTTIRFPDVV